MNLMYSHIILFLNLIKITYGIKMNLLSCQMWNDDPKTLGQDSLLLLHSLYALLRIWSNNLPHQKSNIKYNI